MWKHEDKANQCLCILFRIFLFGPFNNRQQLQELLVQHSSERRGGEGREDGRDRPCKQRSSLRRKGWRTQSLKADDVLKRNALQTQTMLQPLWMANFRNQNYAKVHILTGTAVSHRHEWKKQTNLKSVRKFIVFTRGASESGLTPHSWERLGNRRRPTGRFKPFAGRAGGGSFERPFRSRIRRQKPKNASERWNWTLTDKMGSSPLAAICLNANNHSSTSVVPPVILANCHVHLKRFFGTNQPVNVKTRWTEKPASKNSFFWEARGVGGGGGGGGRQNGSKSLWRRSRYKPL